jgi:predicted ATPase/DNA-binding SARP family transcriptional activator/Tfp pilus assembly protein PilF
VEPTFRLRFLGAVQITQDDQPVRGFESRKALALLGYLAMQNRPIPREQLVDLFWGDKSESRGRANLSWVLNKIASLLPDCIQADRHDVQFQRAPAHWLDIDAFAQLETQRGPDSLAAAVALYQGEFLEGLSLDGCAEFELWLVGERERWCQRVVQALEALVTHHGQRGEWEEALRFARRLLALEPWREETHRQVMRLLARSGQRSAALAQYESCRRTLAEELGIEPLPETTALYERIQTATRARKPDLPLQPTRFVGREEDLAHIASMLNNPECRLLTILGPGGVGKTRLALQAAADQTEAFLEGVFFIPLAPLSRAEHLTSAIAEAVGFSFAGQGTPKQQLLNHLRGKEMLLILDNFEHLIEEAGFVAEVLRQAPEIALLVTSREPLNLRWEWRFEIKGLHYPAEDETPALQDVAWYSAIQLFEHIARRARPRFQLATHNQPAVIRVCHLIEGLPLGIELAAAWVGEQTCAQIAEEIEGNLDFLATSMCDMPERHRSLRATFEHSWRLLSPQEQHAFAMLSVFRGGFQPEAAGEVIGDSPDVLQSLAAKSLLRCLPSGRCEMHELLRQYAAEKLSTQPEAETRAHNLHCTHYTTFLKEHKSDLNGKLVSEALAAIKPEIANVRAAWRWAVQEARTGEIEQGLSGLSHFYLLAGPFQEAEKLFELAANRLRAIVETDKPQRNEQVLLGKLVVTQAQFQNGQGKHGQASALAQAAIDLAHRCQTPSLEAEGHLEQGEALWRQKKCDAARTSLERAIALARSTSQPQVEARGLCTLGNTCSSLGNNAEARVHLQQALHICRQVGDQRLEGKIVGTLGNIAYEQGDYAEAQTYYEQVLRVSREIGNRLGESLALGNLAIAIVRQGNYAPVSTYFEQALHISREIGDLGTQSGHLTNFGNVLFEQGDYVEAASCLDQALLISRETGRRDIEALVLNSLALNAIYQGEYTPAEAYCKQTLHLSRESGDLRGESMALSSLSLLSYRRGDAQAAYKHGQQAIQVMQKTDGHRRQAHILVRLGFALESLGRLAEAGERYRTALELRRQANQRHLAMEPLAGLVRLSLELGDLADAKTQVEEILDYLETDTPKGVDEPFLIYLTCYRVLRAAQDARAREILTTARHLLQEQAAKISDEEMRRSFLENVAAHREITAAFESQGSKPAQA